MVERTPLLFAPGIRDDYYVDWPKKYTGSYDRVMHEFSEAGFEPHFYQPDWRCANPQKWSSDMARYATMLAEKNRQEVVMAGFSCGALIATLATRKLLDASNVRIAGLAVFSMAPWFGEPGLRSDILYPYSGLHAASEKLKAKLSELALPYIDCPVQSYVGSREVSTIHEVHESVCIAWPDVVHITTPADHNIFAGPYLNAIRSNVGALATAIASD